MKKTTVKTTVISLFHGTGTLGISLICIPDSANAIFLRENAIVHTYCISEKVMDAEKLVKQVKTVLSVKEVFS